MVRGKWVALKILKTKDKQIEEFLKEWVVMSAIKHENIVQLIGVSKHPKLCMVMEYCSRGSLYHVLKVRCFSLSSLLIIAFNASKWIVLS
jgi:serine/threonine protein kinase